ncbi:SCO6745 family protein [Streptomyces sp. WMMC1477]|uniref:SCO6745 family protein n=1 Tax=Streptomyces sp. WMMC1477 TaxID=3015155 RepID=UPI0022B6E86A|nr:hypothetical protein [Streptomyces sp. WMMC1477]MCZ7431754.1 hypothetical protein [Streptomyces sp. WMMC1477]
MPVSHTASAAADPAVPPAAPTVPLGLVRRLWQTLEPLHAIIYFAPEATEEAAALGLPVDERWPSYFAWRAAPLGAASAELVTATFHSFSPAMVRRHLPGVWATAAPEAVLDARLRAADAALRAALGERVADPAVAEAAELARSAALAADHAARPLAAANAALPWPAEPHLVLWQAVTRLREHRGDGHLAALLAHGLDPVETLVSHSAAGAAPAEVFASRGWTDAEWAAATERLTARGWLAPDGTATEAGRAGRAAVERLTDELAAGPWTRLGVESCEHLAGLVLPAVLDVVGTGLLPERSTLGIGMSYPHQD